MELLDALLAEKGIHLSATQSEQFDVYYQELVEWNSRINLTSITEEKEVAIKHFFDSITPAFYYSFNQKLKLCDVGSGAGFPGIPLKILFPEIEITIVDSLQKRLNFLQSLAAAMKLDHLILCHERAEVFAHNPKVREQFDVVTARAVANLSVLSEYCLPLVCKGGTFIALKGLNANKEVSQAEHAIQLLGGTFDRQVDLDLPEDMGARSIVFIDKTKLSPANFPRKPGIPAKNPL